MARSVRGTAEIIESGPPPWHKRYRLLVQLGSLLVLGGIVAAVAVILVANSEDRAESVLADIQLRQDLAPLMSSIALEPADLPSQGWVGVRGGLGIQGNLRELNLGAATAVAESVVGNGRGWSDAVRLLSSGIIVAGSPAEARAAFERLRVATPEETLSYLEPAADRLIGVQERVLARPSDDRFAVVAGFERGVRDTAGDPNAAAPLQLAVTVLWTVVDRALIFVALNDFFASPPPPDPVDLERWLDDVGVSYLAAEAALAAQSGAAP